MNPTRRGIRRAWLLSAVLAFALPRAAVPDVRAPAAHAPHPQLAIWCEFMPYRQVLGALPDLARYDCALLLHVGPDDVGNADLARVCRAARSNGVEVAAWFLLPYKEHLYVGEASLEPTRDLARRFAAWSRQEQLGLEWVVFDCEPSPLLGRRLFECVRRGQVFKLARVLRSETDPERFAQAVRELNDLIDELHGQGFRVMGAANRVFLDFLRRGHTSIEDALNAPFSMVRWDRISFITYRYHATQVQYVAMVNRYAALAARYFGERAGLDLGLLGDQRGIPEHRTRAELFGGGDAFLGYLQGMRSVYDLREVVAVALGRGVQHINLYSLEGAVGSVAGLDLWLKAASESEPVTGLARWTPVGTAKMGFMGFLLNGLFTTMVGHTHPSPAVPPAAVAPDPQP
ncbi:MAG: hypothetical protein V1873_04380 [Verrucomicrobiota bacterium]